jgi:hypothetical protein
VGAFVYVELVEAEKYLSWPAGTKPPPGVFPWSAARSSETSVLRRVALCPSSGTYTLPVVVYAFQGADQAAGAVEPFDPRRLGFIHSLVPLQRDMATLGRGEVCRHDRGLQPFQLSLDTRRRRRWCKQESVFADSDDDRGRFPVGDPH